MYSLAARLRGVLARSLAVVPAFIVAPGPGATPHAVAPSAPQSQFSAFADRYFAARYTFFPSEGTAQGFHEYDTRLENLSADAYRNRIAELKRQIAELDSLRAGRLTPDEQIDATLIDGALHAELFEADTLRSWRHNPMGYVYLPGGAIDVLLKRDFAPARVRLESVTARLRAIPSMLAAMRANVATPPKEFTEIALRMAGGSVGFFRQAVADWAKGAAGSDRATLARFTAANDSVVRAMEAATKWLKQDLLPRSTGSYAIGAKAFATKLRYEEMVDLPLDRLLAIGEANLRKDHDALVAIVRQMDSTRTPQQIMASLADDHPAAADLIPFVESTVEDARSFLVDHHIVTIPSEVRPKVKETPPYARTGSFASMDTPGPFETRATEAFYYVTPPEKDWTPEHVEQHLRLYNRPVVDLITVHEVFPGHYLQFLYAKQFPTKTRKLIAVASNAEGWAHYSEQMMIEEGFRRGNPKAKLAQLSEALVRDCRFVVGIKLHTQHQSVADGAKCFTDQAYQTPANAYEEARRGAYNPTYLYYTLGKLEIYKLRRDFQKRMGSRYSLQGFHDLFVQQGALPLPLVRKIMLPGDTGTVL